MGLNQSNSEGSGGVGERIRRARKAAGLSLCALGERVGLPRTTIQKYEDGTASPCGITLIELSRALNIRNGLFFRRDVEPIALSDIKYRKRNSLPKRQLEAITHEVKEQIERLIELESYFPKPPVRDFAPPARLPRTITSMDEIEAVAECIREEWSLGLGPIPRLAYTMESNGLLVFLTGAAEQSKFDGLAAKANDTPVAVVGREWPGDRQRFTLAHELGHFVLDGRLADGIDEENACNRFAGAFLFPRAAVMRRLGEKRLTIGYIELVRMKQEFGLSMSGILYRARDLGIVSRAYFGRESKFFREVGWNLKEPGHSYPHDEPHMLEQLVLHALAQEYIGMTKAAGLLNLSAAEFADLLSVEKDRDLACL